MEIKKVGVVGCGIMGSGLAQVCAQSGYEAVVSARSDEKLKKGLASIEKMLSKGIEKGKISQRDKDAALSRIKGIISDEDFSGFSDCDLIIEAVTENINAKREVFAGIDKACPQHTSFATCTSGLSVINISGATKRADKVMGMHFFNPVPIMELVEIKRTIATSDGTIEVGKKFVKSLGKTSVVTKDLAGSISNRLTTSFFLNAVRMLEANVATAEDIDTAIRLGNNHPMGPLAVLDLIGLDTFMAGALAMYEETKDPQFFPPALLQKMVAVGWLGRKSGKGFFEYK
jgi:3-hydroxybutyryl-CoA dehydrogenase